MKIEVATLDKHGNPRPVADILADARAQAVVIREKHSYIVRVNGKAIGMSSDMPGLTCERATALYAELLDRANDPRTIFTATLRAQDFGVYKRNPTSGKYDQVPGLFHEAEVQRAPRIPQRLRWVR